MICDKELYQNVNFSFKKHSSKSIIAFFMMIGLMGASYFAFMFATAMLSNFPLLIYPLLFLFSYVNASFFFGFDLLIYLLYSEQRAVLGHLLYYFKDVKRMFLITFLFFSSFVVLGIFSFVPYSLWADKTLDKEIFAFAMASDVQSLLNLNHGFSVWFYLSLGCWFVLFCFFLFLFGFVPLLFYENPKLKVHEILKKDLQFVFENFSSIFRLCFRVCIIPFLIIILCFAFIILASKIPFVKFFIKFAQFVYPIAVSVMLLHFLFALSAFYDKAKKSFKNIEESSLEQKIYLLEASSEYKEK